MLADQARRRLQGDVHPDLAAAITNRLDELIEQHSDQVHPGLALAICVSPEHSGAVRLGRKVLERLIIDDTFATRDLVADVNRTAVYRVVTISDRKVRLLVGDRSRLIEERDETWPITRDTESTVSWTRHISELLLEKNAAWPLPTVLAGVERTVRRSLLASKLHTIGMLPGNHDRTSWTELHNATWPLVSDWLRNQERDALQALDRARSARLYASGLHEIWPLANEGRVATLVVEDSYAVAARITDEHLMPAADPEAPDVVDDIVDDLIETVLRQDGIAVIIPDGHLATHGNVAAVLRY
jgi:hypothetical protein